MQSLVELRRERSECRDVAAVNTVGETRVRAVTNAMRRRDGIHGELAVELVHRAAYAALHVCGTSMHPAIRKGDVVRVVECELHALRPGDVVLLRVGGLLCVHRLVRVMRNDAVKTPLFQTAGDAVSHLDQPVLPDAVIGRVETVVRNGVAHNLRSSTGRLVATRSGFLADHARVRRILRGLAKVRLALLQSPPPGEVSSREN